MSIHSSTISDIITEEFPTKSIASIEEIETGIEFVAVIEFTTTEKVVLKIHDTDVYDWKEGASAGPELMEKIRTSTTVPIPEVLSITHTHPDRLTPYYIQEYIEGDYPTESTPINYSYTLGSSLAELHNMEVSETDIGWLQYTPTNGFTIVDDHTTYTDVYIDLYEEYLTDISTMNRFKHLTDLLGLFQTSIEKYSFHSFKSYCHTDIKAENILVDESGEITAILDWETPLVGNPLYDIVYAQMRAIDKIDLTEDHQEAFKSGYESTTTYDITFDDPEIEYQLELHRLLFLMQEMANFNEWYEGYSLEKRNSRRIELYKAIREFTDIIKKSDT